MTRTTAVILFLFVFLSALFAEGKIKVACVGNSVTFGTGIGNSAETYPAQLQAMLGESYEVRNFGHAGATLLKNGHNPYWQLPEFEAAKAFAPDIVIIHLGLNDTDPKNWPRYRDSFISDYTDLIAAFKTANPKADVKICRMTPIFTAHARFKSSTRDWFWQIQQAIETAAQHNRAPLIDLHAPLHRRPDLFPDALHPTAEGAKIIAQTVFAHITGNYGALRLAPVFANGMVLQRNKPIRFWGAANSGSRIQITFNKQSRSTTAADNGKWEAEFPPMPADNSPRTLVIESGNQKIELSHILIGDVWLCSGQSNMEFTLRESATAAEDISAADFPEIRFFNMRTIAQTNNVEWNQETLQQINQLQFFAMPQNWERCSPASASNFSAIAYHFGRAIHQETHIPIGLILNAVGGSPTESWISRKTLEYHPRLVDMFQNWAKNDYIHPWCRERAEKNTRLADNPSQRHPYHPSYLYEAGMAELAEFGIAGVIWYQGESNAHNVELHEITFPTLVKSWREAWHDDFPFYFVQLSGMAVGRETWGHFRDSQRRILSAIPRTGMAVSLDWGDSADVHPRHKKPIGERLARLALADVYNREIVKNGPLYKSVIFSENKAIIAFSDAKELKTSDGAEIKSLEIAGPDRIFHPAQAVINGNTLQVWSSQVSQPKYVRYGWKSFTDANLVNEENLPASTFSSEF